MNRADQDLIEVKLSACRMINGNSGILRFKRFFTFKAGQVIQITDSPDLPPRLYSIASSESDPYIEILYKEILNGALTPKLRNLTSGDRLLVSLPFGSFTADDKPSFFIATGTGVAPFISMLRSGNTREKILIHGSRELSEFYYSDYLMKLLGENYRLCYSGNESSIHFRGRVTHYLKQLADLSTGIKYYLCGSSEMVVDTRQILIDKGIPFQNIFSEIYF